MPSLGLRKIDSELFIMIVQLFKLCLLATNNIIKVLTGSIE